MLKLGSSGQLAWHHLAESNVQSHIKNPAKALHHYNIARDHAHSQRSEYAASGQHHKIAEFDSHIAPMFKAAETLMGGVPKSAKPKAPSAGIVSRVKSFFKKSENDAKINSTPGKNPKHAYVPLTELSEPDQKAAHRTFQGIDMGGHHYPVDKESKELVLGASRMKLPENDIPKANESFVTKPEHTEGMGIYIHAPGTEHHGAFGSVAKPSPYFPNKVGIQIKLKGQSKKTVYVEPNEVRRRHELSKVEVSLKDNVILLSKSKATLKGLKRRNRK